MSIVLTSETGIIVSHLLCIFKSTDGPKFAVRLEVFSSTEDTAKPIEIIHEEFPGILVKVPN